MQHASPADHNSPGPLACSCRAFPGRPRRARATSRRHGDGRSPWFTEGVDPSVTGGVDPVGPVEIGSAGGAAAGPADGVAVTPGPIPRRHERMTPAAAEIGQGRPPRNAPLPTEERPPRAPPSPPDRQSSERLGKPTALAVLSSDCISSSAYATGQMLIPLIPVIGMVAFSLVIPITIAVCWCCCS